MEEAEYVPVSLLMDVRDKPILRSDVSPNWSFECCAQAAPIWSLKSYHEINFSLVSSCFQGACRQGRVLEAWQWALEMVRTDSYPDGMYHGQRTVGKGESNFWTRAIVICAEDIAFGNPCLLIAASRLLDTPSKFSTQREAELEAMIFTKHLAVSEKSRVADWACISRFYVKESYDDDVYFSNLVNSFMSAEWDKVFAYMEGFITQSLADKSAKKNQADPNKFKAFYPGQTFVKHYKNRRIFLWLAIFRALHEIESSSGKQYSVVREIVTASYKIAIHDKFRWSKSSRLFGRTAALSILIRDQVEERGLLFKPGRKDEYFEWPLEKMDEWRLRLFNYGLHYGVPNMCKDKHTGEGKSLGRGVRHFIEVKARLLYEMESLKFLNDQFLTCSAINRHKIHGFDVAKLRREHDVLANIEIMAYTNPHVLRFGFSDCTDEKLQSLLGRTQQQEMLIETISDKVYKVVNYFCHIGSQLPYRLLSLHRPTLEDTRKAFLESDLLAAFELYAGFKVVENDPVRIEIFMEETHLNQYGDAVIYL